MTNSTFLLCVSTLLLFWSVEVSGQENRTIDGVGNNLINPEWGAAGDHVITQTLGFSDSISAPSGLDWPNPRAISNAIFSQNNLMNDHRGLSAYTWVWGQFIDHDITLSPNHPSESLDISVPAFDPYFDPSGTGSAIIPMPRSVYDPGTGTSIENPRQFPNEITAFIDGSAVYGSDEERMLWLRTLDGGKLKTSAGNLLPYNTLSGEYNDEIDPEAPAMEMPMPFVQKWFVAGDVRANENPVLTAVHTIFMREHNRLCEALSQAHPGWTDEQLFQHARKLVGGIMQAIVYEEWLPALGLHLPPYFGYDETVNPGIMNAFNTAAYRYGHTTINSLLVRMDDNGEYMPQGDILLRDAFFNPGAITEVGGIEPYLIGMATVVEQDFDCKVIDDLRNFLFGQPGAGGMDLVAINLNRGRDRGLPDYNTLRADFGLPPFAEFNEISEDLLVSQSLEFVYEDISRVDPWVGMLAEDHMPDALFGKTAMTIISLQFDNLRNGDRFYYENDPGLSPEEKGWIKNNRLADVIRRNSPITIIQDEIFLAETFPTSVFEARAARGITYDLYPNPVHHMMSLRIEMAQYQDATLRIVNGQGQAVMENPLNLSPGNNIVSLTLPVDLPAGIYFAVIHSGNRVGSKQFFKR